MSPLPHSIELHDSRVTAASIEENALVVHFRPAYVHKQGKGWRQDADLVISAARIDALRFPFPLRVSDGTLKTARGPYHNLLMLPLRDPGPVVLELEFESGEVLHTSGEFAEVRLFGEATFVEDNA